SRGDAVRRLEELEDGWIGFAERDAGCEREAGRWECGLDCVPPDLGYRRDEYGEGRAVFRCSRRERGNLGRGRVDALRTRSGSGRGISSCPPEGTVDCESESSCPCLQWFVLRERFEHLEF